MSERNWQFGCGCGCGCEVSVKNVAWVVKTGTEPCDACGRLIADPLFAEDFNDERPAVWMELGWCGCGNPDLTDSLALRFLEGVEKRWTGDKVTHTFPYGMDPELAHTWA